MPLTPGQLQVYTADFARFDANGNGALDIQELAEMAKFQLGNSPSSDAVQNLVAEMDE